LRCKRLTGYATKRVVGEAQLDVVKLDFF